MSASVLSVAIFYGLIVQVLVALFLLQPLLIDLKVKAIRALLKAAGPRGVWTFYVIIGIVALTFADSIHRIYAPVVVDAAHDSRSKEHRHDVQRFINQRNFYLHGMFLFCAIVNKGLLTLNAKISELREQVKDGGKPKTN